MNRPNTQAEYWRYVSESWAGFHRYHYIFISLSSAASFLISAICICVCMNEKVKEFIDKNAGNHANLKIDYKRGADPALVLTGNSGAVENINIGAWQVCYRYHSVFVCLFGSAHLL
jgi:hypothetical protein